ncbi:MAG TPA: transcription elongation factor GreA [Candidatus Paceibacterota bacterium]|nr:transcription elongation factor GreA [Candidatus Pacearchaeota archaeon]HRZ50809.1 transcription elongation factor GreA [Candidatus Paceibacterota bacterium]HSA36530.1 transcription elongation factor GreA [Candidatus Paceibacterota bacterium]
MSNYLTPEGLEKFKKELENLETVKRRELADKLNYAISFGDLKENAAYHEAKEAQGFLEGRIQELKAIISNAKVVEKNNNGMVGIGSTVLLSLNGSNEEYSIVSPEEADIFKGKLSFKSPLGKLLIGKAKGSRVNIETPGGKSEYLIVDVR